MSRGPGFSSKTLESAPTDVEGLLFRPGRPDLEDPASQLADGVIDLLIEHTGQFPTRIEAAISADLAIVRLANRLTTAEKQLLAAGHDELVLPTRDLLLRGMRTAASAIVEQITDSEVVAYLIHNDLELAVIGFVLDPGPRDRPVAPKSDGAGKLDRVPSGRPTAVDSKTMTEQIVDLLEQRTGTAPGRVRTAVHPDMVVLTFHDCLTTAEKQLVSLGHEDLVISGRRTIHQALSADACSIVERHMGCEVTGYLSDQSLDPDTAVIVFYVTPPSATPGR